MLHAQLVNLESFTLNASQHPRIGDGVGAMYSLQRMQCMAVYPEGLDLAKKHLHILNPRGKLHPFVDSETTVTLREVPQLRGPAGISRRTTRKMRKT